MWFQATSHQRGDDDDNDDEEKNNNKKTHTRTRNSIVCLIKQGGPLASCSTPSTFPDRDSSPNKHKTIRRAVGRWPQWVPSTTNEGRKKKRKKKKKDEHPNATS